MIATAKGLEFSYKSHKALKEVSFSLKKGECTAVLGTNGAGKSTLLKCLNRLLKPQKGTVLIENTEINTMPSNDLAKNIAYVSQHNSTSSVTVFDAVLMGRKPYIKWDINKNDLNIVNNVLKLLELEDFSMRYIDELSGGEYQKVLIARALAQEPNLLMLDEPTSSLDLKNQLEVISIIKRVVKSKNISAIISIHDINLSLRFADSFILLHNGKIFAVGGIEIINAKNIEHVYSVPVQIEYINNKPIVIPL